MSRILVADDNSNIQKMVALALKDEGIDVVAVGNGEAAMRRIPELRPDLVLADIFMPVRNGYEVCEFVKNDSRYMSTPVVLLVGAFDPLDEQETQRVRADGVLKKPFVPPDPLVNMVKALLAKSNGQKSLPVAAPIPPEAANAPAAPSKPPLQAPPAPMGAELASLQSASSAPAAKPEESTQHATPAISSAQPQPPVFATSAKNPDQQVTEPEDSDEVVTAVRDPNLGEPFWATPEEAEEEGSEEESETKPADMLDMHSFGSEGSTVEGDDEPRRPFRPDSAFLDKDDFGIDSSLGADSQMGVAHAQPSSQTAASGQDASDAEITQYENATPPASSATAESPVEMFQFDPRLTFPAAVQDASIEGGPDKPADVEARPLELSTAGDAEILSWPGVTNSTAEQTPAAREKTPVVAEQTQPIELDLPALPDHEAVITAATEAARLAFSELNTLPGSGPPSENPDRNSGVGNQKDSFPNGAANPPRPTPEMIEAVVNRLLERMQPQIMEVVNREVLRPAIEAIVQREMKKN